MDEKQEAAIVAMMEWADLWADLKVSEYRAALKKAVERLVRIEEGGGEAGGTKEEMIDLFLKLLDTVKPKSDEKHTD